MKRFWTAALCLAALLALPLRAGAEWPYLTEEASTLGGGHYSLSAGVSQTWQDSARLPGGEGILWSLPQVEGTLGVGPHAEVSASYELLWFDPADGGDDAYESGDLRLWTKLSLFPAWISGASLRFGVKLPNASEDRGLGTDETDFFLAGLYDLHFGQACLSLNAGLGLVGSTERNQSQDDVFTWGAALRGPVWRQLWLGFDAAGYTGPFGAGDKRDYAVFGPVIGWHGEHWRVDVAGRRGVQDALSWGWVAGVTYER